MWENGVELFGIQILLPLIVSKKSTYNISTISMEIFVFMLISFHIFRKTHWVRQSGNIKAGAQIEVCNGYWRTQGIYLSHVCPLIPYWYIVFRVSYFGIFEQVFVCGVTSTYVTRIAKGNNQFYCLEMNIVGFDRTMRSLGKHVDKTISQGAGVTCHRNFKNISLEFKHFAREIFPTVLLLQFKCL